MSATQQGWLLALSFVLMPCFLALSIHSDPHDMIPKGNSTLRVALLGDSVIDDAFWIKNPKHNVKAELMELLVKDNPAAQVVDFSVDNSRVGHIAGGIRPQFQFRMSRNIYGVESYPVDDDGIVWPLRLLSTANSTHAVLSVGGNDYRMFMNETSIEEMCAKIDESNFHTRYAELVDKLISVQPNLILIMVYHPLTLASMDSSYLTSLPLRIFSSLFHLPSDDQVTQLLIHSSNLLTIARDRGLPVIDLSRTFNPFSFADYGSSPIEPSEVSGEYIASLVAEVLRDFQFGVGKAKIYSGVDQDMRGVPLDSTFDYSKEITAFMQSNRDKMENITTTRA